MIVEAERRAVQRELLLKFVDRQMEAGKWLLASLLIVNGGAIVAMMSNATDGARMLAASGTWFVGGVVGAFLAGSFSWILSNGYFFSLRQILRVRMYRDEDLEMLKRPGIVNGVAYALSLIAAMGSLGCFSYGAYRASAQVRTAARPAGAAASTPPALPQLRR